MKRRTRMASPAEALQLMVDPMCNFFAGLVFLSVLAAVLSKNQSEIQWTEEEPSRKTEEGVANQELLSRRLADLREEIQQLQKQNRAAAEKLGETSPLPGGLPDEAKG